MFQVEQKDVPLYDEWIGTTDGMSGYLLKRDYTEGAFVKQGQLLFEIDPRPLEAALGQAQGDLAKSGGQSRRDVARGSDVLEFFL